MPFNVPVTVDQEDIILAGGYTGRDYLLFTPFEIVLQARPASDSSASVLTEIEYNNVASGDYEDVREDMTFFITTGTSPDDFKAPLFRGRITQLPTSSILYVNEASIALDVDLYITVVHLYEPSQRLRSRQFIDGWKTFEKLPPAISGLSSSYVKEPVSGEAQFSFAPVGQAMEEDAAIDNDTAWHWEFSGSVTYDTGDEDTREITVTLSTGHVWVTLTCTDSNGVAGKFVFEVYVQDRYTGEFIYTGNEGVDITNDWQNGVNASVNYFDGVQDILDRWRCTVVTFESFRDGDAEMPNVSFVGYLRQDDNESRGDTNYGTLKQRSYTIAGFASLMGECKQSPVTVFDKASPAAWDEMTYPNAARTIEHLRQRYAVGTLQCIDYGDTLSNDFYGGDMDVQSPFLLDACNAVAEEIDAQLIFAADGQMCLRRNASLLVDDAARDALSTIMAIPSSRIKVIGYTHPHTDQLAQLVIGFRSYRTADKSSLAIRGTAPAVSLGDGPDFEELPARLLTANATEADARTEAGQRTAAMLAYRDEGDEFTFELDGGFRFMQPSVHQWWTADIAASLMTNNVPLTDSDRLLLKSVSHKFSPERGTRVLRATFRRETVPGLAMILVEVIPAVVPTALPPRPPLPAYQGAFNPSGTLNYTSPAPVQTQPYDGGGFASVSMPYSPAQQAQAGQQIPPPGCRVQTPPVNFRNPSDVLTPFATVNGADYVIRVRGSARLSAGGWHQHTNFLTTDGGFTPIAAGSGDQGVWTEGVGWEETYITFPGPGNSYRVVAIEKTFAETTNLTQLTLDLTWIAGTIAVTGDVSIHITLDATDLVKKLLPNAPDEPTVWTGSATGTVLTIVVICGVIEDDPTDPGGTVILPSLTTDGTGTNPFTGDPGEGDLEGDAFYQWTVDEDGEAGAAELYPATRGLRLNSTPVAVPPEYNANHEYTLLYTGDGNPLPIRFQDDNYDDNENAILYVLICGEGVDS